MSYMTKKVTEEFTGVEIDEIRVAAGLEASEAEFKLVENGDGTHTYFVTQRVDPE